MGHAAALVASWLYIHRAAPPPLTAARPSFDGLRMTDIAGERGGGDGGSGGARNGVAMKAHEPRAIRLVEDRWTTVRHIVEALAIVAAGAWAFYTFFYQERIKPAGEPAALTPTITISRLGRDARREILNIAISYHNAGKTEIDIAADAVNLWGIRYGPRNAVMVDNEGGIHAYRVMMPEVSHRLIASVVERRAASAGGAPGFQNVVEPGATTTVSNVIALPRGEYDLIRGQIVAVPVKLGERNVRVDLVKEKQGGTFLRPDPRRAFEDDNETDFALTP